MNDVWRRLLRYLCSQRGNGAEIPIVLRYDLCGYALLLELGGGRGRIIRNSAENIRPVTAQKLDRYPAIGHRIHFVGSPEVAEHIGGARGLEPRTG